MVEIGPQRKENMTMDLIPKGKIVVNVVPTANGEIRVEGIVVGYVDHRNPNGASYLLEPTEQSRKAGYRGRWVASPTMVVQK
jgi:hypothetical protein